MHSSDDMLTLIKAALIHAQFETIHPFLDGNGRTGRMLITFYLLERRLSGETGVILVVLLQEASKVYYERLFGYHFGSVSDWVDFFLDGVIEIAGEAIDIVGKSQFSAKRICSKYRSLGKRSSKSAALVLPKLYEQPIANVATIQKWTGFSRVGSQSVINRFIEMGILTPKDKDKKYGQSYIYKNI